MTDSNPMMAPMEMDAAEMMEQMAMGMNPEEAVEQARDGALQGAELGATFGPVGAGFGAGWGAALGYLNGATGVPNGYQMLAGRRSD